MDVNHSPVRLDHEPDGSFGWSLGVALAGLKLKTPLAAYLRECEALLSQGRTLTAWVGDPPGAQGRG
jgi:hypothetical protein